MNSISHKQAIQFIDRRMDEILKEGEQTLLDDHLRSCDSCRVYSAEMESLPADLNREFRLRWDSHPEPSERFTERVVSNAKRVSIRNNFSLGMRWLAGATALILLALVINLVVSQLQRISPSTTNTATAVPTQDSSTFPQNDSGLVAFSSIQNGNSEIYTMHGDGSSLTNITNNPADDSNPNWSPDGQHIAFVSDRDGTAQIYRLNTDGSNVIQLTHDKSEHYLGINVDNKYNPWSPDGSKLLYSQSPSGKDDWSLFEIGIDGKNQILLASGKFYFTSVSWSPDGQHVAYVINDSPNPDITYVPNIYVINSDGTKRRELKTLIAQNEELDLPYYWSSDDESIIFVANQEGQKQQTVYQFNFLTDSLTQIAVQKSRVVDWQTDMALIFDTEKVVPTFIWQKSDGRSNTQEWSLHNCLFDFTKSSYGNLAVGGFCNDTNKFELYWANADGSASKLLYESGVFGDTYQMADITWSPDDQYVTFMLGSDVQTHLYILNVQAAMNDPSTQPQELEIGADQMHAIPSWRPGIKETAVTTPARISSFDNRLVAFTSPQDGNSDIFVMNMDGTNIQNLTNNPATDRNPIWSPDGQKIAFESDRNGKFDVYVMNADGSDLTQVTTDPAFDSLAASYDSPWSPDGKWLIVQSDRDGHDSLYVISIDEKHEAVKISDAAGFVTWSPSGGQIAYSYRSAQSGLNNTYEQDAVRVVNRDGSNQQDIWQNGLIRNVRWSTDGRMLYYLNGAMSWEIVSVDATGGKRQVVLSAEDSHALGMAWFSPDSTIVYQGTDPQGRLSLYRFNAGKSALIGQYDDELENCPGMASANTNPSHDTVQAISYLSCEPGQVTFTVHDLIHNTNTPLGSLSLINPDIHIDWSQDDQVIAIRIVQSDVSLSSAMQASLYILRRDKLSQPLSRFKPVIEQTNGLKQVVIQPISTK